MSIIEIKNVTKTYNETIVPVHALNGITLSFEQGEFSAIVGPSGSGKTTLLNILGGLDKATSGQVFVNGVNIGSLKGSRLTEFRLFNIGFVFQSFNLIPVLTVKENVEFIMQLQGAGSARRTNRINELLSSVGLLDRINSRPNQLSGGQQQRVAVARALASKPKFVLADEPTANLDSKTAQHLLDSMAQLNKNENVTFIFSTHDQRVMNKARRIITIEDGLVVGDEKK